jgi:hypothetical protein
MIELRLMSVPIPSSNTTQQQSEEAVTAIQKFLNDGWGIAATNVVETHIVYTLLRGVHDD